MYSTCVCVRAKTSLIFLLKVLKARALWIFFATPCARTHMGSLSACSFIFSNSDSFSRKKGECQVGLCAKCLSGFFFFFHSLAVSLLLVFKRIFFLFSFANWSQAEKGIAVLFAREFSRRSMTPFLCSLPDTPCMRANVILLSHTIAKKDGSKKHPSYNQLEIKKAMLSVFF